MQPACVRVGRGVAGIEELHHAGQDDVAVPALGQAAVSLLLLLLRAALLRLRDDVGVVLEDGGVIIQRLADVRCVLVEDGVVRDDIKDAALLMQSRMAQRKAQAGERLAAARGDGERDDTARRGGLFVANVGDFRADAVDFARTVKSGFAEALEGLQQRVPVGRGGWLCEGILPILEARGIPAVRIDEEAQQQAAEQAGAVVLLSVIKAFCACGEEPIDFGTRGEKERCQLVARGDVSEKPADSLVVMQKIPFLPHGLQIGGLSEFIQTVAQPGVVAEDAQRDELRRHSRGGPGLFRGKPLAIGIDRAGRCVAVGRGQPVR